MKDGRLPAERLEELRNDPQWAEYVREYETISTKIHDLKLKNGYHFLLAEWKRKPYPKQQGFVESSKPFAMFCGAQGTGKTTALIGKYAGLAIGRHPTIKIEPPADFWIVGLSFQKVDQVLVPLFRRYLPAGCEVSYDAQAHLMRVEGPNGYKSTVGFMSAESGPDKFQSNRLNRIGFDEAPQKSSGVAVFSECLSRFKPGEQLGIDMAATPWEIPRFYRDKFYIGAQTDPDNVDCFVVGLADNPYVPREQVEYQSRQYTGKEYRARILGEFVDLSGLVFDTLSPEHHLVDDFPVPSSWPRYRGIDPTEGRRPWSIVWGAMSPEGHLFIYDHLEVAGTYDRIVSAIHSKNENNRLVWTKIDPFASKHDLSSGDPWTAELARRGLFTERVDRSKRSLYRTWCAQRLGDPERGIPPKMFFFKKAAGRVFECFLNHAWDDHTHNPEDKALKEKEADTRWKDLVDATLYMISGNPVYMPVDTYYARQREPSPHEVVDSVVGY